MGRGAGGDKSRRAFLQAITSGLVSSASIPNALDQWTGDNLKSIAGSIASRVPPPEHAALSNGTFKRPPSSTVTVQHGFSQYSPVIIVGAGVSGLSAAWKLKQRGISDSIILESQSTPGGNARSGTIDGFKCPLGAHYIPLPYHSCHHVSQLLEELSILKGWDLDSNPIFSDEDVVHGKAERIFVDGEWYDGLFPHSRLNPADKWQIDKWFELIGNFKRSRTFTIPVDESVRNPHTVGLDRITMDEYLRSEGLTSEALTSYIDYCCRDDYGCGIQHTSAWAALHYFAARDGDDVLAWSDGNGHVVNKLCDIIGRDSIICDQIVSNISRDESTRMFNLVTQNSVTGEKRRFHARKVIYCIPRFTAPFVISGYGTCDRMKSEAAHFSYAPWMVANVSFREGVKAQTVLGDSLCWDNVIHGSKSVGYVSGGQQQQQRRDSLSWASQMASSLSEFGNSRTKGCEYYPITYYRPLAEMKPEFARVMMLRRSWEDWVKEIVEDLSVPHPNIDENINRVDIHLYGHAMVRPTPGFIWSNARIGASKPFHSDIYFAHSDMSGVSVFEEALYRGVRAADALVDSLRML